MQPKSAIFISAALTAFVLVTLVGVVNALKNVPATPVAATQPAAVEVNLPAQIPTSLPPTTEAAEPTATAAAAFGPLDAVTVASQFMNRQDVYSVESTTYNQTPAYKVVFSSGDIVYVGLDGQVITTTKLQPVVVSVAPTNPPKKHRDASDNNSTQSPGANNEHESEHD